MPAKRSLLGGGAGGGLGGEKEEQEWLSGTRYIVTQYLRSNVYRTPHRFLRCRSKLRIFGRSFNDTGTLLKKLFQKVVHRTICFKMSTKKMHRRGIKEAHS